MRPLRLKGGQDEALQADKRSLRLSEAFEDEIRSLRPK